MGRQERQHGRTADKTEHNGELRRACIRENPGRDRKACHEQVVADAHLPDTARARTVGTIEEVQ